MRIPVLIPSFLFGQPFKDDEKTRYKRDILYYNYTLKTNGDEEDVDTLIKLILEEIDDIQTLIENQIMIKKEVFYYNEEAEKCYEKLFTNDDDDDNRDDKMLIKEFQQKITDYSIKTNEINTELLKNNFEITI